MLFWNILVPHIAPGFGRTLSTESLLPVSNLDLQKPRIKPRAGKVSCTEIANSSIQHNTIQISRADEVLVLMVLFRQLWGVFVTKVPHPCWHRENCGRKIKAAKIIGPLLLCFEMLCDLFFFVSKASLLPSCLSPHLHYSSSVCLLSALPVKTFQLMYFWISSSVRFYFQRVNGTFLAPPARRTSLNTVWTEWGVESKIAFIQALQIWLCRYDLEAISHYYVVKEFNYIYPVGIANLFFTQLLRVEATPFSIVSDHKLAAIFLLSFFIFEKGGSSFLDAFCIFPL